MSRTPLEVEVNVEFNSVTTSHDNNTNDKYSLLPPLSSTNILIKEGYGKEIKLLTYVQGKAYKR